MTLPTSGGRPGHQGVLGTVTLAERSETIATGGGGGEVGGNRDVQWADQEQRCCTDRSGSGITDDNSASDVSGETTV